MYILIIYQRGSDRWKLICSFISLILNFHSPIYIPMITSHHIHPSILMASSPTTPPPVSFTSAKPKTKSTTTTTATTTNTTPSFRSIPAVSAAATIFLYQRRRRRCYSFQEVAQLHAQLTVSGLLPTTAGMLIESYLSVSHVNHASLVLDTMPHPDVFAYNILIRGLTDHNQPYHSLLLFRKMILLDGLIPDTYTYTYVLKACSHHTNTRSFLFQGKQVHCRVIKAGIPPHTHVHSSLIHMYSNSDCLDSAELVLKECTGCQDQNTSISNSMISGYLRHGCIGKAKQLFDETTRKDIASWSAVVSGYTRNGMYVEALNVFREMMVQGVQPNESTVVSALSACARIGALDLGRWIHKYVDYKIGAANLSVRLGTSLVDMYAKCGNIDASYEVFKSMVRTGRDVVTWGAMISGFAIHGQAEKCFELFNKMIYDGICPNEVIFVAILSACSHVGYVEEGHRYFNQMVERFGVNPSVEHYGCMVDLLGRAGQLAEAEELISSMPVEPNSVVWGSLLASCRTHKDIQRGKRAFRCLTELDPKSGDRHKLAGHMFAAAGELEEAVKVRKLIKEKEMETTRGSSFIEVDGMVHEFVVGDTSHSEAREIYAVLKGIMKQTYCQEKDKEECCFQTSEQ